MPLVLTAWTIDWLSYCVRPPAPPAMSMRISWSSMPRPVAQLASPAPGAASAEAPKVRTGSSASSKVVAALSRRPSGAKATMPVFNWPLLRPAPVMTSLAGTARISANHWFGTLLFRKSICRVRLPPLESDAGIWIEKSGLIPVPSSASYMAIELVEAL